MNWGWRLALLAAAWASGAALAQVSPARPADEIEQRMDADRRQKSEWEKEKEARSSSRAPRELPAA